MRLLVIRTSAMGDVALTAPVLKGMTEQYPEAEILLLTRASYLPFFRSLKTISFFTPDLKKRHKGLSGIFRLLSDINSGGQIDYVVDLHDVLRSKILRLLFRLKGVPSSVIDKGRSEKHDLITGKKKIRLKHTVERYCDVFAKAGFPVTPSREKWIIPSDSASLDTSYNNIMKDVINIGVAPLAKHKLKMWPEEYMIALLRLISSKYNCRLWLFGGMEDSSQLEIISGGMANTVSLAGKLSLDEELLFMSRLDLMIAMDSSNMHMAALLGTKVISIWGGTDPLAGFSAWMQPDSYAIRVPVDELTCRPCTIYGKGETRNNFQCMLRLTPEKVFQKIDRLVLSGLNKTTLPTS
jgi:ADP-heptose:LPS heptosyltransferase